MRLCTLSSATPSSSISSVSPATVPSFPLLRPQLLSLLLLNSLSLLALQQPGSPHPQLK